MSVGRCRRKSAFTHRKESWRGEGRMLCLKVTSGRLLYGKDPDCFVDRLTGAARLSWGRKNPAAGGGGMMVFLAAQREGKKRYLPSNCLERKDPPTRIDPIWEMHYEGELLSRLH